MHTNLSNSVGIIAAVLTTVSLLPQVLKTYKTRQTRDLSIYMLMIFNAGICLWFFYGLLIKSIPMIIGNVITISFSLYLLLMKIKNKE
ncbi:SemiSWEET family sugar transporter [Chlamydiota bacterium]